MELMSDFRSYAPDLGLEKSTITLSPFESHHLVGTNRAKQGNEVILFNGTGLEWKARLEKADKRRCVLIKKEAFHYNRPTKNITLAIALIKGKTFDSILRQATELGIARIQPLTTQWTQVQIKNAESKCKKWQMQLVEACKQSGNPWLPILSDPKKLDQLLEEDPIETAVVASLESKAKNWSDLKLSRAVTLFIGPEGDFTPDEYQLLIESGAQPVSLGPHVLRSETAAVSALSVLSESINQIGD
jgi:16S rRNA (uracil1498-N3)-methyltransferase